MSLTTRLALLFGAVAAITFTLAGGYLYGALADQLARRDDTELIGKVELIRHLLDEFASLSAIRQDPHVFENAIIGHRGLLVTIRSPANEVLLSNAPSNLLPSLKRWVTWDRRPQDEDIIGWTASDGNPGRAIGAEARVGGKTDQLVQFIVALQTFEHTGLLVDYQRNAIAAAIGGTLIAAVLGYAVARRGLRPVAQIAAQARKITASHLDERYEFEGAPAELRELVMAFNQMLDRVKDGVDRLSQFSSDLAHDLRTPIANLLGETQVMLARQRSTEEYQTLLASNIEELERLSRMIENMLFLARADNAQLALRMELLDARVELQRIADYFENMAADAGVTISVSGDGPLFADKILLQRAVGNLVSNALLHHSFGSEISILVSYAADWLSISVRNRGPVIPAAVQCRIFDRFYRADAARSVATGSLGLGLAIVRSIMQLHCGKTSVSSTAEAGTEFVLMFPVKTGLTGRGMSGQCEVVDAPVRT